MTHVGQKLRLRQVRSFGRPFRLVHVLFGLLAHLNFFPQQVVRRDQVLQIPIEGETEICIMPAVSGGAWDFTTKTRRSAQDGQPYLNPVWGAAQARAFASQRADVIFGASGTTGQGALLGAAQSGVGCIGTDIDAASDRVCLLATSVKFVDRGVRMTTADAIAGRWRGGIRALGLADDAVGLSPVTRRLQPEQLQQVQTIADLLAAGQLATGA